MIYYIIPSIVILFSLVGIFFVIIKKLSQLKTINVESISQEKVARVKNQIILERLIRKFTDFKNLNRSLLGPVKDSVVNFFKDFYHKIIELEKNITDRTRPLKSVEVKQEAQTKINEGSQLFSQGLLDESENKYIEAINMEPRNADAYIGLSCVYVGKRDYKKARETSRYALKLLSKIGKNEENGNAKHKLACGYADLSDIYQLENKNELALTNMQRAVELEPNNPRFLDSLLKISIILRNKDLALKVYSSLKAADPENKKLPEIKEEIDNLPVLTSQF